VLFGDYNPNGKLPITFYKNSKQLPDYEDYSMKGRTYRYFNDALFPFGYGLSYTQFELGEPSVVRGGGSVYTADAQPVFEIDAELTNTGNRSGSNIVQVYIRNLQDSDGPLKSLRAFKRTVNMKPGEKCHVSFVLSHNSFEFWDPETNTMRVKPGKYEILVGTSSLDKDLKKQTITIQ
jgi:beta-glucosidase